MFLTKKCFLAILIINLFFIFVYLMMDLYYPIITTQPMINFLKPRNLQLDNWLNMKTKTVPNLKKSKGKSQNPFEMRYNKNCAIEVNKIPNSDIQMLNLYEKLKFQDKKYNRKLKYRIENIGYNNNWEGYPKLKVFLVPFSHNDPGWIKTYEEHYETDTKRILDNIVSKLTYNPEYKIIWEEVSFLKLWWDDQDDYEDTKDRLQLFLDTGQLEIVSGGWVMNDEANCHWNSILQQLTLGHQWLKQNLNYTPQSAWTIDPFGLSPVMAEMFRGAGLKNLVIQRVHYEVKKYLAARKQLEFRWKELYDGTEKSSLFTHMMPYYYYSIPWTCGPDHDVCIIFDFTNIASSVISSENIAHKAELLLNQYRKKAANFSTNMLLVPLGSDFLFKYNNQWLNIFNNYQKLSDYINANASLNAELKFATLTEYFDEVKKEKNILKFPTLTGDFFTYSDEGDRYWSGYFTSRPLLKRMERILLSYVKASDIILTLMRLRMNLPNLSKLLKIVERARQSLALFQHHDAISGTSRDLVMLNYGKKMAFAIQSCQFIIQYGTVVLLIKDSLIAPEMHSLYFKVDEVLPDYKSNPVKLMIDVSDWKKEEETKIVLFNPLPFTRNEVVRFRVSTPDIKVIDNTSNEEVECQINPIFEFDSYLFKSSKFELAFVANVPPLGLTTYTIQYSKSKSNKTHHASLQMYETGFVDTPILFSIKNLEKLDSFTLSYDRFAAEFNDKGLLTAIHIDEDTVTLNIDFAKYGVQKKMKATSGAYIFYPDEEAKPINITTHPVIIVDGPIFSSVTVHLPNVVHSVVLYNSTGADGFGFQVQNLVDISDTSNFEFVMRLNTSIKNGQHFFTDLNGHQIIRRKRFKKLPIQGNYYPMPTTAYIEDKKYRLTVLTGAPLGCSSLKEGQLEIMMDRTLNQDDDLGLGQGVTDNHPVQHIFNIVLENRKNKCQIVAENHPSGFHTIASHLSSQTLLSPIIKLIDTKKLGNEFYSYFAESTKLGIDFTIASLRSSVFSQMTEDNIGLVINRQYLDTCFQDEHLSNEFALSPGTMNLSAILPFARRAWKSSLTFLYLGDEIDIDEPLSICPMSTEAFLINTTSEE